MAIDLGNAPVGTPPTTEQIQQIKYILGITDTIVVTISATTHTMVTDNKSNILRFTNPSTKTMILPVEDAEFNPPNNTLFTIRNAAISNITIVGESIGVTINGSSGSDIVNPNTTAQLLYLGSNVWDIL